VVELLCNSTPSRGGTRPQRDGITHIQLGACPMWTLCPRWLPGFSAEPAASLQPDWGTEPMAQPASPSPRNPTGVRSLSGGAVDGATFDWARPPWPVWRHFAKSTEWVAGLHVFSPRRVGFSRLIRLDYRGLARGTAVPVEFPIAGITLTADTWSDILTAEQYDTRLLHWPASLVPADYILSRSILNFRSARD
jgi:hypothetical protein